MCSPTNEYSRTSLILLGGHILRGGGRMLKLRHEMKLPAHSQVIAYDSISPSPTIHSFPPSLIASWRDHRTHRKERKRRENSALNPKAVENSTSRPKL
ncbi:hypothetical protein CEXT_603411 [Caerostris extrusa]|uniref:Uncharacterized protein n=1 Tax=Caerostris extrusa TaxID=172846 RepID=A0AAV4PVP3_CAEEX|nr:hypothetical protein CEXT_603411 [Caerostris extrusa]